MLKKLIFASAILAATTTVAFANGAPYVGVSVGANAGTFKLSNTSGDSIDFGGRGAIGGLFAGYGMLASQNIYVGGEVFANLTSTQSDINTTGTGTLRDKIYNKYGYGISFIPGVMLSDHTLAYARVGVVRSKFEVKQIAPTAASESHMVTGGQLGVGLQTSLTQNVDFRTEYDFTVYRASTFDNINKVKPRTDTFNVGLIYKFD